MFFFESNYQEKEIPLKVKQERSKKNKSPVDFVTTRLKDEKKLDLV